MRGKVNDYCMYSRSLWQEEHDFSKVIAIRYHIAIHIVILKSKLSAVRDLKTISLKAIREYTIVLCQAMSKGNIAT